MNFDIQIRHANAGDATGMAIVHGYSWLTTYAGLMPQEVLDMRVNNIANQAEYLEKQILDGVPYIVAESKGAIVGFAAYCPSRDENYPSAGEIQALYLLKSYQGHGLGAKLFERCVEELRAAGFVSMIVNCLEANPAIGFYERMGGRAVGVREDRLSSGHVIREKILRFEI